TAAGLAILVVAGAGLWSWQHQRTLRRAEKDFQTALTRRSVESALEHLPELHSHAMWNQAEVLLGQADEQLGAKGDGELRERLDQARGDTAFIKCLDQIRLDRSMILVGTQDMFDYGALDGYPAAFLEHGLDILDGESEDLVAQLNASP